LVNGQNTPDSRLCPKATDGQKAVMAVPLPVEHQEVLTAYPWDDDDSLDKVDEPAIGNFVDGDDGSGVPNSQQGIYSESGNNAALRFGIGFTNISYHKINL
jgi:hypothetical protein